MLSWTARGHVRRVGGDEALAGRDRLVEGRFEERQRGGRIAAGPEHAAPLELEPRPRHRRPGKRRGVVEECIRLGEPVAQPRDASELRQHLGAAVVVGLGVELLTEPLLRGVEVAEVPQRPEPIVHERTLRPGARRT